MTDDSYQLLREFNETEGLNDFIQLMDQHVIRYKVEDSILRFDASFANNQTRRAYRLLVMDEDMQQALQLADQYDLEILKNLPADYYLYQFSREELTAIVYAPDEWNNLDVLLATQLLENEGIIPDHEKIDEQLEHKQQIADAPESNANCLVVCGYLLCGMGIIIGFIIALILVTSTKVTSSGNRIPYYSENIRWHGRAMILLSVVVLLFGSLLIIPQL